jgi:hypothetical protein
VSEDRLQRENDVLRARVLELERELGDQAAATNLALAAAQDRVYWLDRARIDLNALAEAPFARVLRTAVRRIARAERALRRHR